MMTSVLVSIEDIMPDVRRMMAEGRETDFIISLIREQHGPGYGGMVMRAIARIKAESA